MLRPSPWPSAWDVGQSAGVVLGDPQELTPWHHHGDQADSLRLDAVEGVRGQEVQLCLRQADEKWHQGTGAIADRMDRRRLLLLTQIGLVATSGALAILPALGALLLLHIRLILTCILIRILD